MKTIWNYIFYSTWVIHKNIGFHIFEKNMRHILGCIPFFASNLKKGERFHRNFFDNKVTGMNVILAYRCMLSTSMIILASLEICIFFTFDTGLSDILHRLFNFEVSENVNSISFFISVFIFSYLLNEILLGMWNDKYIDYFNVFEETKVGIAEYLTCFIFHVGSIFFCIGSIIYFDV